MNIERGLFCVYFQCLMNIDYTMRSAPFTFKQLILKE